VRRRGDERLLSRHPSIRSATHEHPEGRSRATVLRDHAYRGDFSQWVLGVFGDHDLARQLGKVEARWDAANWTSCARRSRL
jgi:hypothetical protein